MASHAEWAKAAEDLSQNLSYAAKQYTLGQVSHMTGLAQDTIRDSLTRRAITNELTPRGALCRPQYRIESTPLWAPVQVQEYFNRVKALAEAREKEDDIPTVTAEEAEELGLVTNREIKERLGVHDQTVRRYQRADTGYPPAVAKLSRGGSPGVPERLRRWADIVEWARAETDLDIPDESAA